MPQVAAGSGSSPAPCLSQRQRVASSLIRAQNQRRLSGLAGEVCSGVRAPSPGTRHPVLHTQPWHAPARRRRLFGPAPGSAASAHGVSSFLRLQNPQMTAGSENPDCRTEGPSVALRSDRAQQGAHSRPPGTGAKEEQEGNQFSNKTSVRLDEE